MSDEEHPSDPSDFDADALAALARPSGAPPAMDDDGDEGMLDLRALAASAPLPASPEDEPEAASDATPSTEPAKAEPSAAVTAPVARPADTKKGGGGLVIGVGIGLAAAAAVFFFMRGQGGQDPVATAGGAPTSTETQPASPPRASGVASPQAPAAQQGARAPQVNAGEANVGAPEANAQPSAGEAAVEAPPSTDEVPAARPGRHGGRRVNRRDRSATNGSDRPDEPEQAASAVAATGMSTMHAEAEEPDEDRSMDALLNSALGGEPNRAGTMTQAPAAMAAAPPAANLPESPSRSVVTRVLGGLMGQMRRCAGDQVGMANARIRISNDGTVASVSIAGSPFGGTPQGRCMEGVVRRAHFPRFRRPTIDLTFPFSIRPLN